MRRLALILAGCGSSAAPPSAPANHAPAPPPPDQRCLPVVSKQCGCTYTCGLGTRAGDRWNVHHAFWQDAELHATIIAWPSTTGGTTEAFDVDIVCDGICMPKPVDPKCECLAPTSPDR